MIDPHSGRASGPNAAKFGSYLGVLARSKVSILIPDWDHVTEEEKDLIWQDLCVSNKFIGYNNYIMNYFFSLLDDLFIYFCRQALSLKSPASLGRRLCHPLGQIGGHSRPS